MGRQETWQEVSRVAAFCGTIEADTSVFSGKGSDFVFFKSEILPLAF